jgi:hypothetical protein
VGLIGSIDLLVAVVSIVSAALGPIRSSLFADTASIRKLLSPQSGNYIPLFAYCLARILTLLSRGDTDGFLLVWQPEVWEASRPSGVPQRLQR